MGTKTKFCVDCGKRGTVERRRCRECALEYNRQRAKKRHKEKGRYNYGMETCPICKKPMIMWRKEQGAHARCRKKTVSSYNKLKRTKDGMMPARKLALDLGIDVPEGYVIHHVDENPENNSLNNLWLMSRSSHNSLHRKLQYHGSLWLKNQSKYDENCWNTLRDHLTTAWLETTSAKVIKLGDIGQSAAEPLNEESHGEGSEAMHVDPKDNDK